MGPHKSKKGRHASVARRRGTSCARRSSWRKAGGSRPNGHGGGTTAAHTAPPSVRAAMAFTPAKNWSATWRASAANVNDMGSGGQPVVEEHSEAMNH